MTENDRKALADIFSRHSYKAKALRRVAEPLITRARVASCESFMWIRRPAQAHTMLEETAS